MHNSDIIKVNTWAKNMNRRILVVIVSFTVLMILLVYYLGTVLLIQDDSGGGFYSFYREKAPIDVIVFGSSHAACTVNNAILYEEAGIASYTLSAGSQPLPLTYYYMKEAFSVQKPKVALVETLMLDTEKPDEQTGKYTFPEGSFYRSVLSMRWSPAYLSMIAELNRWYDIPEETRNNYLWKWPIIHSRYKDLSYDDAHHVRTYIRGYKGDNSVGKGEVPKITEDCAELNEITTEYLKKIIRLCEENDVKLIFFTAPYPCTENETAIQNSGEKIADEVGVPFINYNKKYDELHLDFSTDLRDDADHLNNAGAAKVTRALMNVLNNNDLPDRRNDKRYTAWNLHEEFLENKDFESRLLDADFGDYIKLLKEEANRYVIVICMSGNFDAQNVDTYKDALAKLGIAEKDYNTGGMILLDHGLLRWYSGEETTWNLAFDTAGRRITMKGINEKNGKADKSSEDGSATSVQGLWLDEDGFIFPENGFSFLVYDDKTDQVLDYCTMDVYKENTLTHQ